MILAFFKLFTNFLNSLGSNEALWSNPLIFLERVKCFSITIAPKETATIELNEPNVWSEYPTGTLNFLLKVFKTFIFASLISEG